MNEPRRAQLAAQAYEDWQEASRRHDIALAEWLAAKRENFEALTRFRELVAGEGGPEALREPLAA